MQSRFERKFGKYAIKNLSLILIICYAVGYLIQLIIPKAVAYLYLDPAFIIHNFQIWRLFTWILVPPDTFSFWTLIMLYFYYSIGTSLERTWGAYRYNIYLFSGFIFTIVGAFVLYAYLAFCGINVFFEPTSAGIIYCGVAFTTYYVNMSIFLAYAATFPDAQVLLLFIIPIRVKYLGIIYGAMLVYEFVLYAVNGMIPMCVAIVASLLNFVLFFFTMRKKVRFNPYRTTAFRVKRAQQAYNNTAKESSTTEGDKAVKMQSAITRHKCALCGATEITNPEMQFRFCSKCNGNYEYCEKHIFTHNHVGQ